MRIALGADHAGVPLKATVAAVVERLGHTVIDCGTDGTAPVDFPGIRCGLAHETHSAHQAVEHDNANANAMGAWLVPHALVGDIAGDIVEAFLGATCDEDVRRRVAKLNALDLLLPEPPTGS